MWSMACGVNRGLGGHAVGCGMVYVACMRYDLVVGALLGCQVWRSNLPCTNMLTCVGDRGLKPPSTEGKVGNPRTIEHYRYALWFAILTRRCWLSSRNEVHMSWRNHSSRQAGGDVAILNTYKKQPMSMNEGVNNYHALGLFHRFGMDIQGGKGATIPW